MRDSRRVVAVLLVVLAAVIGAYWGLWYGHRSLVASETASYYQNFESAFPLADGLLAATMLAAAWSLWRRRPSALLCGLLAAGGAFYLFGMDVLFDVEHGVWGRGANGSVELAINLVTVASALALTRWFWRRRVELQLVSTSDPSS